MPLFRFATAILFCLGLTLAGHSGAGQPILVYERFHAHVATDGDTIRLQLFDNGRAEIRFPHYMRQAGVRVEQLTANEFDHLVSMADSIADISQSQLATGLAQARLGTKPGMASHVTDSDTVRLIYRPAQRSPVMLQAPSPSNWSRHLDETDPLSRVAAFDRAVLTWMRERASPEGETR